MRYHYISNKTRIPIHRTFKEYTCNHPCYSKATLYSYKALGLCVVQQYFDAETKATHWGSIETQLAYDISVHPAFKETLVELAGPDRDGLYPTIPVRKLMWKLRMKPLKKEQWETTFDRTLL